MKNIKDTQFNQFHRFVDTKRKLIELSPTNLFNLLWENPNPSSSWESFKLMLQFFPELTEKWIDDRWAYWKHPLLIHALLRNNIVSFPNRRKGETKYKLLSGEKSRTLYSAWSLTRTHGYDLKLSNFLDRFVDEFGQKLKYNSILTSVDIYPIELPEQLKIDLELALKPPFRPDVTNPDFLKTRLALPLVIFGLVVHIKSTDGTIKYQCLRSPVFLREVWKIIKPLTGIKLKDLCQNYLTNEGKPAYNIVKSNAARNDRSSIIIPPEISAFYQKLFS